MPQGVGVHSEGENMKLFFQWVVLMVTGLVLLVVFSRAIWSVYSTYLYMK